MSDTNNMADYKRVLAMFKTLRDEKNIRKGKISSLHYKPVFAKETQDARTKR